MSDPARFWAVDLHVHTPASKDVIERQYGAADPADLVKAALSAGLDAIAITDHNTIEWCESVANAAASTPLVVLPGVEVTTTEGHLLGIWEEGTLPRVLDECLVKLGIGADDRGKLDISADKGIAEAAKIIQESGGLAIAAHADQEKGLLRLPVAAHVKQSLLTPQLAGVEIVDAGKIEEVQRKVGDQRQLAFVRGSDMISAGQSGHRLSAIGNRRTWVKASRPDVCGLRHALEDPNLRIRLEDPSVNAAHPRVTRLSIAGGFLDGMDIVLSPDLNCLVGGTGTGKSLALECLRFALHQQVDENEFPAIAKEVKGRLAEALGQDSTITVELIDENADKYVVERSYDESLLSSAVVRHQLEDGELILTDLRPDDVLRIHAFSQGEALEYSRAQVGRMALIDASIDLADINARIQALTRKLRENGIALLEQRSLVERLKAQTTNEAELKVRQSELEALFDSDTVKSQKAWQADNTLVSAVLSELPQPGALELEVQSNEADAALEDNAPFVADAKAIVAAAREAVETAITTANTALEHAQASADALKTKWGARFSDFRAALTKALELVPGQKSLVALRDQLESVQSDLTKIATVKRTLADNAEPKLEQLNREREQILTDLMKVRQERRDLRRVRIRELNAKTTGVVKLDLPTSGDRSAFRERLNMLKVGSRLGDSTLDAIARNLHPAEFAEAMLSGKYSDLAKPTEGVTLDALSRLYVNIADKDLWTELLDVQAIDTPDTLTIKFKRDGGEYVAIESLAHGQKCTAILVILLADGHTPVVVDQPEDALHAPWIEEQLVDRLRELRGDRQCLFATRSPGLVLSADAEQIVTLSADAGRGKVEASGSLERHDLNKLVLLHLEGGRLPFKRRHRKLSPSVDGA